MLLLYMYAANLKVTFLIFLGSEGGLRDIIGVMKLREQTRESAEGLLAQIDDLIYIINYYITGSEGGLRDIINYYITGSEGGLRDIIGVMKLREQTRESAEGLLAQIDDLIQTWKARQGLSKRSVPDN